MMMIARVLFVVLALLPAVAAAQAPPPVDTSTIGPRVGAVVPPVSGVDQSGTTRTLGSIYGPKGAMLVFFRSADW
jgi:hypothetical protein